MLDAVFAKGPPKQNTPTERELLFLVFINLALDSSVKPHHFSGPVVVQYDFLHFSTSVK